MKYLLAGVGGLVLAFLLVGGGWYLVAKATDTQMPVLGYINEQPADPASDYAATDYIISTWDTIYPYVPIEHPVVDDFVPDISEEELAYLTPEDRFALIYPLIDQTTYPAFAANYPASVDNWALRPFDYAAPDWRPTGLKTVYGDDVLAYDRGYLLLGVTIEDTRGFMLVFRNQQLGMSLGEHVDRNIWSIVGDHTEYAGVTAAIPANDYIWHDAGQYGTVKGGITNNGVRKYGVSPAAETIIGLSASNAMTVGADAGQDCYNLVEGNSILLKDGVLTMGADVEMPQVIRDMYGLYKGVMESPSRARLFAETSIFAYDFVAHTLEHDPITYDDATVALEAEITADYAAIKEYLDSVETAADTIAEFLMLVHESDNLTPLEASDADVLSALLRERPWGATNGYAQSDKSTYPSWYYEYAVTASVWQTLAQTAQSAVVPYAKAALAATNAVTRQAACAIGQTIDGRTVFAAFNGAAVASEDNITGVTNEDIAAKFIEYGVANAAVTVRGSRASFGWKNVSMLRVDNVAPEGVRIYSVFTMQ